MTEENVLEACKDAQEAESGYVVAAVIAGIQLLEFRDFLGKSSFKGRVAHSGQPSVNGRNQHSDGEGWLAWLDRNGLARQTAERWMRAAQAVAMKILGMKVDKTDMFAPYIDVEGEVMPMSHALVGPESELPGKARKFREDILDFIADKTLAEAVRAALEGESDPSRILRAANGQGGGAGGDRKDFVLHFAYALKNCLAHVGASQGKHGGHWDALTETEKHNACKYVGLFARGMSDELLEFTASAAADELKARRKGNTAQPLALKAALPSKIKPGSSQKGTKETKAGDSK